MTVKPPPLQNKKQDTHTNGHFFKGDKVLLDVRRLPVPLTGISKYSFTGR